MKKLVFFSTQILLAGILFLGSAHAATQNIHIGWSYDASLDPALTGFRLYQDNVSVCHTINPTDREMDCIFDSPYGTFNFYLAAYSSNAESPLSSPFLFTLKEPEGYEPPIAQVSATQLSLDNSLVLELTPGNVTGDIVSCTWSFSDGSPDVSNEGATISHTFPANKVSTYTLTVTDSSGATHTTRMSTITFLKQIHGIVIYHINSFLLKKKNEN